MSGPSGGVGCRRRLPCCFLVSALWGLACCKEGKTATHWTRLSCHRFRPNEVRLLLGVIAYNLGNLLRRLDSAGLLCRSRGGCSRSSLTFWRRRTARSAGSVTSLTFAFRRAPSWRPAV